MDRPTTALLDCRWLGMAGAGRATELALRGLQQLQPAGRWILWGPEVAAQYLWPDARHVPSRHDPLALWGQRALGALPPHDVALYFHQIRPLSLGRSVTLIHDTIPLHQGPPAIRWLKRRYLRRVAKLSSLVLTVSQHSKRCIERDLRVAPERVRVLAYPVDEELVRRVGALRIERPRKDVALFVGRFARHKNLDRLVAAFPKTEFAVAGGELLLVGGAPDEVLEIRDLVEHHSADRVTVRGVLPQRELDEVYATSRLLVMSSLEEGFGFPAWEAICCGLPAAVSDGGALAELAPLASATFPPTSVDLMAEAIDRAARAEPPPPPIGPSVTDFGRALAGAVLEAGAAARAGAER